MNNSPKADFQDSSQHLGDLAKEITLLDDSSIDSIKETIEERIKIRQKLVDFLDSNIGVTSLSLRDLHHHLGGLVGSYFKILSTLKDPMPSERSVVARFKATQNSREELLNTLQVYQYVNNVSAIQTIFDRLVADLDKLDYTTLESSKISNDGAKQILDTINLTLKNYKAPNYYLPIQDLEHRLRGKMDVFYEYQKYLYDDSSAYVIGEVLMAKERLQDVLRQYKDLDTSIVGQVSIADVLQIIEKRIKKAGVDLGVVNHIADNNFDLQCSARVVEAIIYEIFVNYSKYGKDGQLTIRIKNGKIIMTLTNRKKPKENVYSSNNGLPILNQYIDEVGGSIKYDYSQDECTTIVAIPVESTLVL